MGGSNSKKDEVLFKSAYPRYEKNMDAKAIIKLGIPADKVDNFLEFTKKCRMEELNSEMRAIELMSQGAQEAFLGIQEPSLRRSYATEFTQERFFEQFSNEKERMELGALYRQSLDFAEVTSLILSDPEKLAEGKRFAVFADFMEVHRFSEEQLRQGPSSESLNNKTKASVSSKQPKLGPFQFFGKNHTPSEDWINESNVPNSPKIKGYFS